jgi:uncharacterized protein YbjT (DUF2867 family)
MLLLTGATGQVGSALLRRLVDDGEDVRCLVRDPRRLGTMRVRVQIALGDLTDPPSFRNALRGVDTVVHLAATIRDQRRGSIEEVDGIATWRIVRAAQRAGAERFIFFSTLDASGHHRTRFHRAKAAAEQAVLESELDWTVLAPSLVYAPGDRWLTLLERLSLAPAVPLSGAGKARYQPLWAEDAAACAVAALRDPLSAGRRYELAGPDTFSHEEIVRLVLDAIARPKPVLKIPTPIVSRTLKFLERALGDRAFATWDEAELMECSALAEHGPRDVEALTGTAPKPMRAVLDAAHPC